MRGLPQKQNARRADKIRLCGHLGRYKKIVKKTYIIFLNNIHTDFIQTYPKTASQFCVITQTLYSIITQALSPLF